MTKQATAMSSSVPIGAKRSEPKHTMLIRDTIKSIREIINVRWRKRHEEDEDERTCRA